MSTKQWAKLQFARVDQLVEAQSAPTGGWQVRNGQYFPAGYVWDEPHHPIAADEFWGRPDGTAEFIGGVQIPPEMAGKKVWFQFYVGGEVIVYANNRMMDGIDPNRTRIVLSEDAQSGEQFDILGHVANIASQGFGRPLVERGIIETYLALYRPPGAHHHARERRFS